MLVKLIRSLLGRAESMFCLYLLLLHSERRRRSPTPPIDEEERDKRTVFVMQLAARLRTRELADFFSEAGKVRDAKIIADRISRRSKGWV